MPLTFIYIELHLLFVSTNKNEDIAEDCLQRRPDFWYEAKHGLSFNMTCGYEYYMFIVYIDKVLLVPKKGSEGNIFLVLFFKTLIFILSNYVFF
jgi:hypothetical protein